MPFRWEWGSACSGTCGDAGALLSARGREIQDEWHLVWVLAGRVSHLADNAAFRVVSARALTANLPLSSARARYLSARVRSALDLAA